MTKDAEKLLEKINILTNDSTTPESIIWSSILIMISHSSYMTLSEVDAQLTELIHSTPDDDLYSKECSLGWLLAKKTNYEVLLGLSDEKKVDYIHSIIDSIVSDSRIIRRGKAETIHNFIDFSVISISLEDFSQLCKEIFETDGNVFFEEEKINIAESLGLKVLSDNPMDYSIFNTINDLNINLPDFGNKLKYDLGINLWNDLPNNDDKIAHLIEVYNTLYLNGYGLSLGSLKILLDMVNQMDSKDIVDNINELIRQIDGVSNRADKAKLHVLASLFLSVEDKEENQPVLLELSDKMSQLQEKVNGQIAAPYLFSLENRLYLLYMRDRCAYDYYGVSYDYSSIDNLRDSIVYGELLSLNIYDDWINMQGFKRDAILNSIMSLLKNGDRRYAEEGQIALFIKFCERGNLYIKLPELKQLIEAYNNYLSGIDSTNNLEQYESLIQNGNNINVDDFENEVKRYRCMGDRLPPIIYNYILQETINNGSFRIGHTHLVQSGMIDLTYDILEAMNLSHYVVGFKNNMRPLIGKYVSRYNTIIFAKDYFNIPILQRNPGSDIIYTPYHESRHAWQEVARKAGKLSKHIYKISEENAIQKCNMAFYDEHYERMEAEVDGRIFADLLTCQHLLALGYSAEEIAKYLIDLLNEEINLDINNNRNMKSDAYGNNMTIKEQLSNLFQSNLNASTITSIFQDNPLLSLEYRIVYSEGNRIGGVQRRSNEEIEYIQQLLLAKVSNEEEAKDIKELFDYIIHGERETNFNDLTTGEYLKYYGYDIDDVDIVKLSSLSPSLVQYPIFKGRLGNDLIEPFSKTIIQFYESGQPEA